MGFNSGFKELNAFHNWNTSRIYAAQHTRRAKM